jgi:hypothetical protein
MTATAAPPKKLRKKLARRAARDHSQTLHHAVQFGFLALNVWIGIEFCLFVRFYETGGRSMWVRRPPGVEGWLPIALLMNLKLMLMTERVPAFHPAGMFLLIAFLAASWIFRKSFCAWLCPVGTISEFLWPRTPDIRPQFPPAPPPRYRAAQHQVHSAWPVPLRRRRKAGFRDSLPSWKVLTVSWTR